MSTLPLVFRGNKIRALVVGGGDVALRKVQRLLDVGAQVTIISPIIVPKLRELCDSNRSILLLERLYCSGDVHLREHHNPKMTAFNLVIAATDDPTTNRSISDECQADGIPVNVVDVPELCTVYFSAVVRDEPLQISVSTEGKAPFLARHLKRELTEFAQHWAPRVRWGAIYREWVKDRVDDFTDREQMLGRFLELSDTELATWNTDTPPVELWHQWAVDLNIQLRDHT